MTFRLTNSSRWWIAAACALLLLLIVPSPAAHADGGAPNLAYVSGTAKDVSVIDVAAQKVTRTLNTPATPSMILLSLDARFLYVTQPQANKVTILAAKTGETICSANVPGHPTLLALDQSSSTIFAAGNDASTVSGLDTANCTIKRTIDAGGPVHGLAVAAVGSAVTNTTGNQLWVSAGKAVSSFDTVSGKKLGSVDIPAGPTYLSIPPGAAVYVTTSEGSVVAIGLNKREVIPLVSGGQYGPMDFDEITGEVYVPDKAHHQLVVLTPVNPGFTIPHEPNRTIKLAEAPQSIAITSDGQLGFSALAGGKVAMLDIPGRQAITTFDVGGDPHFI
ncbi:MAG: hypothetical protein J2P37_26565, partial [Ktedonobacteraceae bacterium]|nr:hypothetical protein [Ktedonobacteraceae bacterium]